MHIAAFEDLVATITRSAQTSLAEHLKTLGLPYDQAAFEAQTSIDLNQAMREVLFFGANVWPEPEALAVAA